MNQLTDKTRQAGQFNINKIRKENSLSGTDLKICGRNGSDTIRGKWYKVCQLSKRTNARAAVLCP